MQPGDVLFFEAYDPVGRTITSIDGAEIGGLRVSHAGFYAGGPHHEVLDVGNQDGLDCHPLAQVRNPDGKPDVLRSLAVIRHPDGPAALTWAKGVGTEGVDYDIEHVVAAGIAAVLRGLGAWHRSLSSELWERVHRYSRSRTKFVRPDDRQVPCSCGERHLAPPHDAGHWICSSFVDHSFRESGHCLQVREQCLPIALDELERLLEGLVRLSDAIGAGRSVVRGLRFRLGTDQAGGDDRDRDTVDDPQPPGTGTDLDIPGLDVDDAYIDQFVEELRLAFVAVNGGLGTLEQQWRRVALLVRQLLGPAKRSLRGIFGPQNSDGERSPRQGEIAWGPLMSLRLMLGTIVQANPGCVIAIIDADLP